MESDNVEQDPWTINPNLPRGSTDAFKAAVDSAETAGGSTVRFPTPGVTAIVGPNNVGKSTFLKDLNNLLHNNAGRDRLILHSISIQKSGSDGDLLSWLVAHRTFDSRPGKVPGVATSSNRSESVESLLNEWNVKNRPGGFGSLLANTFALYADASSRLGYVQGQTARSDVLEPPTHPMHLMQDYPQLVTELSDLSQLIFRHRLTLDALSGNIRLRVGTVSTPVPPVDNITTEYRRALSSLPNLAEQGDGMRSLFGLLIPIICSTYPIVMVDEPEAFLHPPQASALGRELARLAKVKNIQIFLATHDRSLLTGLLEGGADVSVIKLDRVGNETNVRQLDNDELRTLWVDPVLRYTNALEGLFHRLVVLMEADPDCHFFSAALEHFEETNESPLPSSEILFVPCGGKAGIAKLARSLKGLDVQTVASPDLDVLNDASVMRELVTAMGGDWQLIKSLYNKATDQFRQERKQPKAGQVLTAIKAVLEPCESESFDDDLKEAVRVQMRLDENPWKALKRYGVNAFKGQSRAHADELLEQLADWGVILLPDGELENLAPGLAVRKGPSWLPAALKREFHCSQESQNHVRRILAKVA